MTESFTDRVLREAARRLSQHYTNGPHHLADALIGALRHVAAQDERKPDRPSVKRGKKGGW